jgi:hypothetical protein
MRRLERSIPVVLSEAKPTGVRGGSSVKSDADIMGEYGRVLIRLMTFAMRYHTARAGLACAEVSAISTRQKRWPTYAVF